MYACDDGAQTPVRCLCWLIINVIYISPTEMREYSYCLSRIIIAIKRKRAAAYGRRPKKALGEGASARQLNGAGFIIAAVAVNRPAEAPRPAPLREMVCALSRQSRAGAGLRQSATK